MKLLQTAVIMEKMRAIKRCYKTVCSNYHMLFQKEDFWYDVQQTEKSIVFGRKDGAVYRVYFYTAAQGELGYLLSTFPEEAVIDWISIENHEPASLFHEFQAAGYRCQAVYERYHIRNLKDDIYTNIPEEFRSLTADTYGRYAEEGEAEEILTLLYNTFDPRESHIKSLEEVRQMAQSHNLKVVLEQGRIITLVAFLFQGKKLYIEQVINKGPRPYMYCLYLSVLEEAVRRGINYAYTWVNAENQKGKRLAIGFGHEKEGLKDYIFVKGDKE